MYPASGSCEGEECAFAYTKHVRSNGVVQQIIQRMVELINPQERRKDPGTQGLFSK